MDCKEFEIKLWEKPSKFANKENLPSDMSAHLKDCSKCGNLYVDYLRLQVLSSGGEIIKDGNYWQKFEDSIWQKIGHIEAGNDIKTGQRGTGRELLKQPAIGIKHLVFSLTVAVAAVTVMFIAVSDVSKQMIPKELALKGTVAKKHGRVSTPYQAPSQTLSFQLTQTQSINTRIGLQLQEFSVLSEPEVNIIDDSALVAIDAVYLSDEGIKDKDIKIAKALSKEVVMGEWGVDSFDKKIEPVEMESAETEWVITLEKMPVMKKTVAPAYPALAYRLKKQGEVWIKAHVSVDGNVIEAMIYKESGTNYGFEEEALKAAYLNEFEPFEVNGKRLPVWVIYKVRFVHKE